jgi:hypothetical protein
MRRWNLLERYKIFTQSSNRIIILVTHNLLDTCEGSDVSVDWIFLEYIYRNRNAVSTKVPEEDRKNLKFDPSKYYDANHAVV